MNPPHHPRYDTAHRVAVGSEGSPMESYGRGNDAPLATSGGATSGGATSTGATSAGDDHHTAVGVFALRT